MGSKLKEKIVVQYLIGFVGVFIIVSIGLWLIARPNSPSSLTKADIGYIAVLSVGIALAVTIFYVVFYNVLPEFVMKSLHLLV